MAYNHVATDAMARIARALGVEGNAAVAMHQLARRLGAPMALRELGMPEAAIREAAAPATANPYPNPRPVEAGAIEAMLAEALFGVHPAAEAVLATRDEFGRAHG